MDNNKTFTDIAYEILKANKSPISFKDLWEKTYLEKGLDAESASNRISDFYTSLTLDGRFCVLKDNTWALKEKTAFKEFHIDTADAYVDVDSNVSENENDGEEGAPKEVEQSDDGYETLEDENEESNASSRREEESDN